VTVRRALPRCKIVKVLKKQICRSGGKTAKSCSKLRGCFSAGWQREWFQKLSSFTVLLGVFTHTHTPRNQNCFKITSVLHGIVGKWQSTEQLVLLFFLVFPTPAQI